MLETVNTPNIEFEERQKAEYQVLVVEDRKSDYRLLERSLRRSDLNCVLTWAATTEEALTFLTGRSFDIVLLDFNLPDATGIDLFKKMVDSGYDLPVIFVTALGNEKAAVEAFELGAQDYLVKDIGGEYLNLLPYVIFKGYKQWEDGRERVRKEQELKLLNANLEKEVESRTREIKEKEVLTSAILGSLDSHIAVLDSNGEIISVNSAWERFASENEVWDNQRVGIGVNYLEVTKIAADQGNEYAHKTLRGLKKVLAGQLDSFSLEYPYHSLTEQRWFNLIVTPLGTEKGGVVTTHIDISDKIRILDQEMAQRLWAETLQEITQFLNHSLKLDEVLEGILGQLSRVVEYHSASVMLLDGERLDIVAYKSADNRPGVNKSIEIRDLAHVERGLKQQEPVYVANTNQDPRWRPLPGTEYIKSWVGIPLFVKAKAFGMLNLNQIVPDAFTVDQITMAVAFANQAAIAIVNARLYEQARREIEVRKQAENDLELERASLAQKVFDRTAELTKTNYKLSQAMQAKDQFLANMSHELRTPLTTILGKTEVLREGLYGPLTEKQTRAVNTIHASGRHLLSLINDILDVARIEAGQLKLNWESIAINDLCRSSLQFILEEAAKKEITVTKKIDGSLQTIQGDNRRLTQILVNLLSNALKFTLEGGEIGLEVRADRANGTTNFIVWDTGIGISAVGMQHLFSGINRPKPFVQLENTLARQYPGSGLGLTIVYSLTHLHNGSLNVESKEGQGTRITVSLPMTVDGLKKDDQPASETKEAIPLSTQDAPQQNSRILLVEDDYDTIEGLVDFLSSLGFDVHVANDGEQAIEKTLELNPDLIIMDVQLPKRDGLTVIKMIRSELMLVDVPIIALTALNMPGDRERCLEAGANEYLSKPINLHQATDIIRSLGVLKGS